MRTPVDVYLGLGSNLGDRRQALAAAALELAAAGVVPQRISPLYESDFVGSGAAQPAYLNAVVLARTALLPLALLDVTQAIERAHGRAPHTHSLPRPLDIDILFYGDSHFQHPRLQIPHPRLGERCFVLQPLADLGALASRPDLASRLHALAAVQRLRPAGALTREEWRAGVQP